MSPLRTSAGSFLRSAAARVLARGAKLIDPRDPNTIHHDFEQDVLERMKKLGSNALGVPVVGFHAALNGSCKVMCEGFGTDGRWRKFSVRATPDTLSSLNAMGDPQATAEILHCLLGTQNKIAVQDAIAALDREAAARG